jgi:hypothetical protein
MRLGRREHHRQRLATAARSREGRSAASNSNSQQPSLYSRGESWRPPAAAWAPPTAAVDSSVVVTAAAAAATAAAVVVTAKTALLERASSCSSAVRSGPTEDAAAWAVAEPPTPLPLPFVAAASAARRMWHTLASAAAPPKQDTQAGWLCNEAEILAARHSPAPSLCTMLSY